MMIIYKYTKGDKMTNLEYAYLIFEIVVKACKEHDLSERTWRTSEQLDCNGSVTIEYVKMFMGKQKDEREYTEDHIEKVCSIFEMMAE